MNARYAVATPIAATSTNAKLRNSFKFLSIPAESGGGRCKTLDTVDFFYSRQLQTIAKFSFRILSIIAERAGGKGAVELNYRFEFGRCYCFIFICLHNEIVSCVSGSISISSSQFRVRPSSRSSLYLFR